MLERVDPNNPMRIVLSIDEEDATPTVFVACGITGPKAARMVAAAQARRRIGVDAGAHPDDPEIAEQVRESDCAFLATFLRKVENWPGHDAPVEDSATIEQILTHEMLARDLAELEIRLTSTVRPRDIESKGSASRSS